MKKMIPIIFVLTVYSAPAAGQATYSKALDSYLDSLTNLYGSALRDSIWNHLYTDYLDYIKDTKLGDHEFTDIHGNQVHISAIKSPMLLQVTASWCRPCIEEIPAMNNLIRDYSGKVKFIFLTHDTDIRAKEMAERFREGASFIPSEDLSDINNVIKLQIGDFKHILPYPTTFIVDENRVIRAIEPGGFVAGEHYTKQEVLDLTYERFAEQLDKILTKR